MERGDVLVCGVERAECVRDERGVCGVCVGVYICECGVERASYRGVVRTSCRGVERTS